MAKRKQIGNAYEKSNKVVRLNEDKIPKQEIDSFADLSEVSDDDSSDDQSLDTQESSDSEEPSEDSENHTTGSENLKKRTAGLSAQDVQIARETSELFKSNIFKLQIDELISELKLPDKFTQLLDRLLFQINSLLRDVEEYDGLSLREAEDMFLGKDDAITIPFPDPKPKQDIKYKFGFKNPKEVNVIGSYSLRTAVRQPDGVGVDVLVTMPKEIFQPKDYVNYRYFHKRAFYLACVTRNIKLDTTLPVDFHYVSFQDDPLRPILRLDLNADWLPSKLKVHINIIPGLVQNTFDVCKLSMDRQNIRSHSKIDDGEFSGVSTPWYNFSVLSDTTNSIYLEFLHRSSIQCEAFKDACKLGRLWLQQRGFGSSPRSGGFGHFEWAMLMAILLHGGGNSSGSKILMNGYSSYQIFKAMLFFLVTKNRFSLSFSPLSGQVTRLELDSKHSPIVLDRTHQLNILYKMTSWSHKLLQYEASVTYDLLDDVVQDRFDAIFLQNLTKRHLRFDTLFRINYSLSSLEFSAKDKISHLSYEQYVEDRFYNILSRGYADRSRVIAFLHEPTSAWNLSRRQVTKKDLSLTVGIILNPDECEKLVTHGPLAESKEEAENFRQLWGQKSELRRFQDGSIKETTLWTQKQFGIVLNEITSYLFSLHFPKCELNMEHEKLLKHLPMHSDSSLGPSSHKDFQAKLTSFQNAVYMLQSLDDVPLRIRTVLPTSSSLRYTSIYVPKSFEVSGMDDCMASGIIEFESSNRWPDDLDALEKTKTAFLLKIQEQIAKTKKDYTSTVGIDFDLIPGVKEIGFLQLMTPEGFIFKLRVATDRDELLYQRDLERRSEAIEHYKQLYTGAAKHTRTIQIMSLRYPFYSATARLLKVWLRSQMLLGQIRPEMIDLLALIPFVNSAPYGTPSSPVTAFYRIIYFIANWDWRDSFLALDVEKASDASKDVSYSKKLSSVEGTNMSALLYQKLAGEFSVLRQRDPAFTHGPIFIGTKDDPSGILWSKVLPPSDTGKLVGSRLTSLCRAVMNISCNEVDKIFKPSLKDYNVVIHIAQGSKKSNVYKNLEVIGRFPELTKLIEKSCDTVDAFYNELREKYEESLIFFKGVDKHQRPIIAGLWQREVQKSRKFKVTLGYSTMPSIDDEAVIINKKAIIAEIRRIGGDIIERIDM